MGTVSFEPEIQTPAVPMRKHFVRDIVLTFGGRLVALVATLGVSILTARVLGPHDRGDYFFVVTLAAVIAQFANFGMHSSNTYYSARDRSQTGDLAINSLWLSVVVGAAFTVLVIIFGPAGRSTPGVWYAAALVPANLFFLLGCSLLIGCNRVTRFNVVQMGGYTLLLGLIGFAALLHLPTSGFLALTSLAWGIAALAVFAALSPHITTWRFQRETFFSGVRYSGKAYLTCLLGLLVLRTNVFLLKYCYGSTAVGYFSVGAQMADALGTFPVVVSMLLFPRLIQDQKNSWELTKRSLRNIASIMALLCIAAIFLTKPFILIVYGTAYLKAIPVLLWLLPGVFFLALTGIVSQYLSARGFPKSQVFIWGLGFIFVIILGIILIHRFSLIGASVALSVSYVLVFAMIFRLAANLAKRQAGATYVFSIYPLSVEDRKRICDQFNEAAFLTLIELRRLKLWELVRRFRRLNASRILIPKDKQDPSGMLLLEFVAAVSPAPEIRILDVQRRGLSKMSRVTVPILVLRVLMASIGGFWAAGRSWLELYWLSKRPIQPCVGRSATGLFVNGNLWFGVKAGGSLAHISGVIEGFAQNGIELEYCGVDRIARLDRSAKQNLLKPASVFGLPYELNRFRFHFHAMRQLRQLIDQKKPGFIYQRLSVANFCGVTLSRFYKIPLVLEYNSSEVWTSQNWGTRLLFGRLAERAEEVCLWHAHVIVTVSEPLKKELIARGVPEERIAYYPNCVDVSVFAPDALRTEAFKARNRYGIANDSVVVGFIGTFGQWHGVEILAKAISQLVETDSGWLSRKKVHFLLMGDGQRMGAVREILDQPHMAPFVTLTGLIAQDEAPAHLMCCDLLMSPHVPNEDGTAFFGSPTKLFEYMALGKAIVASDLDQIGQVLKHSLRAAEDLRDPALRQGQLAVLVRPGNVPDLIKGIQFLVERPEWRAYLGENCRAEALTKYIWQIHVREIVNLMVRNGIIELGELGAAVENLMTARASS